MSHQNKGRQYDHKYTKAQVLGFAAREQGFHVSPQYRQDRIRRQAKDYVKEGLLRVKRTRNYGSGLMFYLTPKGKQWLDNNTEIRYVLEINHKYHSDHPEWVNAAATAVVLGAANREGKDGIYWTESGSIHKERRKVRNVE